METFFKNLKEKKKFSEINVANGICAIYTFDDYQFREENLSGFHIPVHLVELKNNHAVPCKNRLRLADEKIFI